MATITAGDFRNGKTFEMDGKIMQVVEFQHVKPGKGAAFVRTKMKNIVTGAVTETSLISLRLRWFSILLLETLESYLIEPSLLTQVILAFSDLLNVSRYFVPPSSTPTEIMLISE